MEDEEKLYAMKLLLGAACGLLSIVVVPQYLVNQGLPVGWLRLLWLLGTWLLLPFPLVMLGLRLGYLGMSEKERVKQEAYEQRGQEIPTFNMKASLTKMGGPKFILKTGVGGFFFIFLLTSTVLFTILYP